VTDVEVFIDPSCPWAWVTSRFVVEVAPQRDLSVTWRSYCLEIRDDYGVAPTVPEAYRQQALDGHAVSHRMLRIFEAARAEDGEAAVDRLHLPRDYHHATRTYGIGSSTASWDAALPDGLIVLPLLRADTTSSGDSE